jgi:uncharacterized paraquat-inducible protein A
MNVNNAVGLMLTLLFGIMAAGAFMAGVNKQRKKQDNLGAYLFLTFLALTPLVILVYQIYKARQSSVELNATE